MDNILALSATEMAW